MQSARGRYHASLLPTINAARLAISACCLASLLPIPPAAHAQSNPPSQGRNVVTLAAERCASCHGPELAGGTAPSLVTGVWKFGGDDVSLTRSIRQRHPATPSLADLNDAEVRGLIVYLRERSNTVEAKSKSYPHPEPGAIVRSEAASFRLLNVMAEGTAPLDDPWALAFLPDGRMLISERPGRLRIISRDGTVSPPVTGIPAVYGGEGGLLDIALHPRFSSPGNNWVYLSYGDKSASGDGMTAVLRGRLQGTALVDIEPIFKADSALYRPGGQRFGSKLLFDDTGHLYFSVGDRAHPGDEQDLSHPNGKVHRINDDGSVPKDNPFVDRPGALPTIWTYGHRNPQGLVFNPVTRELWETEHGPRGGDELNILQPGRNYGWPVTTFGINYDGTPITSQTALPGMEPPVNCWVPSIATGPIAFYTGSAFPAWKNNLLLGSLATQELRRIVLAGHTIEHQEVLFKNIGRVRDIAIGPDGTLYVILNQPGRILKLVP
jgi:aldose sugar dehydrogenase